MAKDSPKALQTIKSECREFSGKNMDRGYIRISSPEKIESLYGAYLSDESRFQKGWCEEICFPCTEMHVCEILREMTLQKKPVTISGARTGIVSGAIPRGGVLMNMEKMNQYIDILKDKDGSWSVWVQPGVRLSDFHKHVEEKLIPLPIEKINYFLSDPHVYFYPPDPTEESALIGSTVVTNASGARSLRYGATREFVKAIRVALSTGDILYIERGNYPVSADGLFHIMDSGGKELAFSPPKYKTPLLKSACGLFSQQGMDIIDLFIGSEGILGIVTAIKLKLIKKPKGILSGLSFFKNEMQGILFSKRVKTCLSPLSLEYFDSHSLDLIRFDQSTAIQFNIPKDSEAAIFWEASYEEDNMEAIYDEWEKALMHYGSSMEETWAGMDDKEWFKLKSFRHRVPELVNNIISKRKTILPELHKVSTDMAVPDDEFLKLMKIYQDTLGISGLEYAIFGHIGDNHLHINIMPNDKKEFHHAKTLVLNLAKRVVSLGGVVSTEHGIGKLKHDLLLIQYGVNGMKEIARIKKALDPSLILGRGNIIPEEYLNP